MDKTIQKSMNDYVLKNYRKFCDEMKEEYKHSFPAWSRLRTCRAYVTETKNFFVLKSYNTIVAIIDKTTGQKFDFLRYVFGFTSTSCQHIAKFFSDYGDFRVNVYTYRDV